MSEEVLLEIRELREEMNDLTAKLSKLRYSDFKMMCAEYMRPIIADEGRKFFENDRIDVESQSICQARVECTAKLKEQIFDSLKRFENGDTQGAFDSLQDAKNLMQLSMHECPDQECSRKTSEIIRCIDSIQQTYLRILEDMGTESPIPIASNLVTEDEVEEYLMPLSNSRRIGILKSLSEGPKTLSSLCKEFDMPTGHISFHLNILRDMEYVSKDSKTKLYSLSAKGSVALNGIGNLIQSLKSTAC